jgi:ATP-binding cassette subfamily A (ABC1) protein 3
MSFLVSAYIVFLVQERQSGCKHLQFVSGVKFWLYWLSHFIVDYITFILPCIGLLITLNIYEIKEFMDTTVQFHFMILMTLFGIAILPFTYLWSFFATNPTTAFSRLVIFYCFIGKFISHDFPNRNFIKCCIFIFSLGLAPMVIMVFLGKSFSNSSF